MRVHDLLFEDVGLVEEQNDGGLLKPGVGDDGFKQGFALLHAVLRKTRKERHNLQRSQNTFKSRKTSLFLENKDI